MTGRLLFTTDNPGKLPVPGFLTILMVAVFSIPLMLIPLTWRAIPENPLLLLLWPAACFPLAVLFVLKRLMSRYGLRVHEHGAVDVVYPFRTEKIATERLGSVRVRRDVLHGGAGWRTWIDLIDHEPQVITTLAASAFSQAQWEGFFNALRRTHPALMIQNEQE